MAGRLQTKKEGLKEKDGLISGLVKTVIRSVAELGVTALNIPAQIKETYKAVRHGETKNIPQVLGKKRVLPFLDETKPAFTGQETTGEAAKKIVGYGAEVASFIVPVGSGRLAVSSLKQAIKTGGKEGVKKASKALAKKALVDFGAGFTAGAGVELQKKDVTAKRVLAGGALGGIIGAAAPPLIGGALKKTGGLAVRGGKVAGQRIERTLNKLELYATETPQVTKRFYEAVDKTPLTAPQKVAGRLVQAGRIIKKAPQFLTLESQKLQ